MRHLFVHNNIPHERREQWPTFPYSHPEGSYICHSMLSGEGMPSSQNYGLCERNHCETAFETYASVWYLWPPRCYCRGPERWVTWCQDPTHPTDGSFVAAFWMGVSRAPSEQPRLGTVTLDSSIFDFSGKTKFTVKRSVLKHIWNKFFCVQIPERGRKPRGKFRLSD